MRFFAASTLVQVGSSARVRGVSRTGPFGSMEGPLDPQEPLDPPRGPGHNANGGLIRTPLLDPFRARQKRVEWVRRACEKYPMPHPWWPLGDENPPPEQDPYVLHKRPWEREAGNWKLERVAAHLKRTKRGPPGLVLSTCPLSLGGKWYSRAAR